MRAARLPLFALLTGLALFGVSACFLGCPPSPTPAPEGEGAPVVEGEPLPPAEGEGTEAAEGEGAPDGEAETLPPSEGEGAPDGEPIPSNAFNYSYEVVAVYPHATDAFTQGLQYRDGWLYEGTGLRGGRSSLRLVDLHSGAVVQQINLADEFFGEGICLVGDRVWQLTWTSRRGFIYDVGTFQPLDNFTYTTEGWGLTHDGERFIRSDGSATLTFHATEGFTPLGTVEVTQNGAPVQRLNELEYIEGEVWANVWLTDDIVRIDPAAGEVLGRISLAGLLTPFEAARADVLNGIAYDADNNRIFVTGKLWPKLFEIRLVPLP